MKLVCISDIHGNLVSRKKLPDGDTLLIAGDVCPASDHSVTKQAVWLRLEFNPWLKRMGEKYKNIVLVAGNHDFVFENEEHIPKLACHYLNESAVTIDGIKFYGHPWTPWFHDWAFNAYLDQLIEVNDKIPEDTNVLITHGPAHGVRDTVEQLRWGTDPGPLGCHALAAKIKTLKQLKLHVFGHIHSSAGMTVTGGLSSVNASILDAPTITTRELSSVNASLLDEYYKKVYDPIVVDL